MSKKILFILLCISFLSFILSVVQFRIPSPPCLNADEASFGYNAYSLLKTGRDEYGSFLPLRLKSFGDYKMPLYSYFSVPFVALFGLTEWGVRSPNAFLSFFFPVAVFFLTREISKNKSVSVLAALLSALSLGLHSIARQAHEAYLAAFLTTLSLLFLIRLMQKKNMVNAFLLGLSVLLMLFSYHPGRLYAFLFFGAALIYSFQTKNIKKHASVFLVLLSITLLFGITDLIFKPERIKSLLFFSNPGIQLKVQELHTEGGIKYLYHPLFIGLRDIVFEHLSYFSPQFLVQNGDGNDRFGYKGMGLITPIEYLFLFVGLYFLFKQKEKWRYILVFLLFFSPLSASLSWATSSLTRTLFSLVLVSIISSYGMVLFFQPYIKRGIQHLFVPLASAGIFIFFLSLTWDFYLFHYPKRLITIHAWQCGYREVFSEIKQHYASLNRIYMTKDVGMPYIFALFYLQYQPELYQKQALLTPPDEYGFGQVESFDKFIFSYKDPYQVPKNSMIVGSIDNVRSLPNNSYKIIAPQGEPMFAIITEPKNR